jgi:hypothetical protein
MLKIKVRGDANAQALFDVLAGGGVRWVNPKAHSSAYVLFVQEPGYDLAAHLKSLFPDMRFTCTTVYSESPP